MGRTDPGTERGSTCLAEASREAMFGSLREGSTLPSCQVGKIAHTEDKGWAEA